jgi:hypothetical protein
MRKLDDIASVIRINNATLRNAIKKGKIKVFKTASVYYCRVDEVKRYMIARYTKKIGYADPSLIVRHLPIYSRERLIKLWLASDIYGVVEADLHHSTKVAFVFERPLLITLAPCVYELTDLAYDIVHALLGSDLVRRQKFGRGHRKYLSPGQIRRVDNKVAIDKRPLSWAQGKALELMLHAPPLSGRDLLDLKIHRATILALKNRGLVDVIGDTDDGRTYAITEKGARTLKGKK